MKTMEELTLEVEQLKAQLIKTQNQTVAQADHIYKIQQKNFEQESEIARIQKEKETAENDKKQLQAIVDDLSSLVDQFKRVLFGKKSEKHHDPDLLLNPLFSDLMDTPDEVEKSKESAKSETKPKKKRKSPRSKSDQAKNNPYLETLDLVIPVAQADKFEADGTPKVFIGYEEKETFHKVSARHLLITQKREIWGSKKGTEGEMITAPNPPHILPKCGITPGFFADIVVTKMSDRLPWYDQSKKLKKIGIIISRGTMARWTIAASKELEAYYERFKSIYLSYDLVAFDATWFNVLKSKHGPGKRACIWSHYGGQPGREVILFSYQGDERKQAYLKQWYGKYSGIALGDGDLDYMRVQKDIGWKLANCNSHARRKFEYIAKRTKTRGLAHDFLGFYYLIYESEAKAVEQNLSQDEHTLWRQNKMKPIFDKLYEHLVKELQNVSDNSDIGKAMSYCFNHWKELTLCLTDSRIRLDTNHVERNIRQFVIGRNNYIFADTPDGADSLCVFYTLIQTAKLHGLNERNFLKLLFKTIPTIPQDDIQALDALLPWNLDKEAINKPPESIFE